jgi:hypothetical protein
MKKLLFNTALSASAMAFSLLYLPGSVAQQFGPSPHLIQEAETTRPGNLLTDIEFRGGERRGGGEFRGGQFPGGDLRGGQVRSGEFPQDGRRFGDRDRRVEEGHGGYRPGPNPYGRGPYVRWRHDWWAGGAIIGLAGIVALQGYVPGEPQCTIYLPPEAYGQTPIAFSGYGLNEQLAYASAVANCTSYSPFGQYCQLSPYGYAYPAGCQTF